jgi:hypothetical protein
MGEVETLSCPKCGAGVATVGGPVSVGRSSSGTTSDVTESGRCESYGARLERDNLPGSPWHSASRD